VSRYDELCAELAREFPGFRVVKKDASRLHRAIDRALRILTFGKMTRYLDGYQTTIGKTVYVTADWDSRRADERYVTMRHEAVHLRQFRRYTLPGMALFYLLLPVPMGAAYFRMRLERAAYEETIRASAEVWGLDYASGRELRERVIGAFVGPAYGWMWPFRRPLERWYDRVLAELDRHPRGGVG
jgi:hypothetical protein